MNIAYITMDFPVQSETFACNDVKKLVELGHNVDVYSLMAASSAKKEMLKSRGLERIDVKYLDNNKVTMFLVAFRYSFYIMRHFLFTLFNRVGSLRQRLKHLYYMFPCIYHFEKYFRVKDYDVIHFFWGHYPLMLGDLLLEYKRSQKFTVFLGAADLSYGLPITKKLAPRSDTVFTHSRTNLKALADIGVSPDNIKVIYRGVDVEYLNTLSQSSKKANLWVASGRLIPSKRFDLAIEFFADALIYRPDLKLKIIGSGPSERDLKELVSSMNLEQHVEFVPWLPHEDLLITLSKADTLLFFSEKPGEKLPNIVKEAMYFKCLCIVGERSGCDELIEHDTHGFILKNCQRYSDCVLKRKDLELENIRANAKKRIVEHFCLTNAMKEYVVQWTHSVN